MITRTDIAAMDAHMGVAIGHSPEDIFWMKFEAGCAFLRHWIGEEHPEDIRQMEQLPEYWAWWQQIWYIRDKKFLGLYAPVKDMAEYREHYLFFHDPKRIADRPNSVIIDSYHRMLKSTARKVRDGINQ